ncbi:MAG: DUF4388 domain-containing protein [Candidatus Edwardsbacteria bacterium]
MGLEGSLADFDLADILQLIHLGKKTGALHLQSGVDSGIIYFNEGMAVHAFSEHLTGDEAVNRILRWRTGQFVFKPDETTTEHTMKHPIQHLVLEAARQIDEWEDMKRLIPSMDVILTIEENPAIGTDEIQLQPLEWRILTFVDGSRSINEICKESRISEFDTCKVLYGLLSSGLIKSVGTKAVEKSKTEPPKVEKKIVVEEAKKEKGGLLGGLFGKKK